MHPPPLSVHPSLVHMATKVRVNRGHNSNLPLDASGMLVHVSEENFMNQMAYHGTANGGTNEI